MTFLLPTHPRKSDTLAAVLAQLILWKLEIRQAYQAADMDPEAYDDFVFDLACLIQAQHATQQATDPTREAMALVGDLVTEWEQSGATIQDQPTQLEETTND